MLPRPVVVADRLCVRFIIAIGCFALGSPLVGMATDPVVFSISDEISLSPSSDNTAEPLVDPWPTDDGNAIGDGFDIDASHDSTRLY